MHSPYQCFNRGNPFLVAFNVFENSNPRRKVFVDFGSVTAVNEGSTRRSLNLINSNGLDGIGNCCF